MRIMQVSLDNVLFYTNRTLESANIYEYKRFSF